MVKFDKQDLLKLAQLSALELYDNEIDSLVNQMQQILSYVQELDQAKITMETEPFKNINLFRDDIAKQTDSKPLLESAPEKKETFFVVPKILKDN